MSDRRLVVYTVVFGEGFKLPMVPLSKGVDYLVLADKPVQVPVGWQLRIVEPVLPDDLPRSSRDPKIRPHQHLSEWTRSLYVDSSVKLLTDPELLWSELMPLEGHAIGLAYQSFRRTVAEEFDAVTDLHLDSPARVEELRELLRDKYPEELSRRPLWGGVIARRHRDLDVVAAMEHWFHMVLRYSRRDQLSLPSILLRVPEAKRNAVELDNRRSEFFLWPHTQLSKRSDYYDTKFGDAPDEQDGTSTRTELLERELDLSRDSERKLRAELFRIRSSRGWQVVRRVTVVLDALRPKRSPGR